MPVGTPRIPPAEENDIPADLRVELRLVTHPAGLDNIFATLAVSPETLRAYLPLGKHLFTESTLPAELREIVITRVAWRTSCEYELAQHERLARRAGLDERSLRAVLDEDGAGDMSPLHAAVISAVDELVESARVSDVTWVDLADCLDDQQLIDMLMTAGFYCMLAWTLNSLGVELDERLQPPPSDGGLGTRRTVMRTSDEDPGSRGVATRLCSPAAMAEQRAYNAARIRCGTSAPIPTHVSVEAVRAARIRKARESKPALRGVAVEDREIDTMHGPLVLRLLVPPTPVGSYLHFHHGGWVFGSVWEQDTRLASIAAAARVAVVSVGYRLAPEHRLPAAVNDGVAAALWIRRSLTRTLGLGPMLVGGESAGAHLALCTLLRLRDAGEMDGIVAAQLSYGMYDLTMTPSARKWGDRFLSISTPWLAWFYDQACGAAGADRAAPEVSPLHADLRGLPPTLLTVGSSDPLVDDTRLLAQALRRCDVDVDLALWPDGSHGFNTDDTEIGRAAEEEIETYLAAAVHAGFVGR